MREDTFQIGDMVTWYDNHFANLTDGRKRFGDGPFRIKAIDPVTSNFHYVGHTQRVHLDLPEGLDGNYRFSGAYFKKV